MKRATQDDDATIKLQRPQASLLRPSSSTSVLRRWGLLVAGALVVVFGSGTAAWMFWPHSAPVIGRSSVPMAVPGLPRPPEFVIRTATEAQIRDNVPTGMTVFRLAANPNILVLDFASLRDQGSMLNRLGAFAEKVGLPHDRVLTDDELDRAIKRGGDTRETFYYGHDYSAATIARFFAWADRDQIALSQQEESLRRLMRQEGWFAEGKSGGLISVPRVGSDSHINADARATILHHELSHGEYFSNPAYADYTHRFWTSVLTQPERDAVRNFLILEDYDPSIGELMENEAQAYLIFTFDPAFFAPSMVGMTEGRRSELRTKFLRDVPAPWMREAVPPQSSIARAGAH